MKVLHVLQLLWLFYIYSIIIVVVVDYASAQRQQQRYERTKQQQQQHQHAEVNSSESKPLRFGTKIADNRYSKLNKSITTTDVTSRLSGNRQTAHSSAPTAPSITRRYDVSPPESQLVAQYDVPIVQKTDIPKRQSNASSAFAPTVTSRQRQQQQRSRAHTSAVVGRSSAPAAMTGQRSNSLNSQALVNPVQIAREQPFPSRARNSNATSVAKIERQKSRGEGKHSRVVPPLTPPPSVGTGNQRENNLRKDASLTLSSLTSTPTPSSTSTSTSTTVRSSTHRYNPPSNPFSFFSPVFWNLSSPPKPSSTKKPPKKYTPTPAATPTPTNEKKTNYQKVKTTTPAVIIHHEIPTTTLAPKRSTTEGPFRIALPTFNFVNTHSQPSDGSAREKDKRNTATSLRENFNCPRESEVHFQLFPKICKIDADCAIWNRDELCCEIFGAKSCVSGLSKPLEETSHSPILGLIPRKCPNRPLAELWWQVQECETDMDCWPRVCCPDGQKRYCRTSQPELETVPLPVKRSFNYLSEYLECTPAPPPIFDLHPKTCGSTLDCFPNVCCQEAGLRHCRPPKKSLLTLMANFLNVDFVKRLTQNIVIK